MATEPRYTFDPVTQRYTLLTPQEEQQKAQQEGGLRAIDSGGAEMGPQGPVGFGMMDPGKAEMGVGLQNFGQFAAQASPMQMVMSPAMTIGSAVAGSIGNSMMGSQVNPEGPVTNAQPDTAQVTSITPDPAFSGLAAANAQQAAQNEANTQQAAVTNTATAIADAVIGADPTVSVSDPAVDAAENATAAAADSGGAPAADSGGGGDGGGDGGGGGSTAPGGQADTGAAEGGWRRGGQIMNYEKGGLAAAAQSVQDKGRGDDKILVHMTPNEVRGLQAIAMQHGGSLTINPETGLVEANFLKSILPMVAGAALAATGVGAPLAALMVGGGTALFTGSLEKGLMAGLGAFGGAGIGSALSAAGATAPAVTGTTGGLAAQGAAGAQAAAASGGASAVPGAIQTGGAKFLQAAGTQMPVSGAPVLAGPASFAPTAAAPVTFGNMASGVKALGTEAGRSAFMTAAGGPMGLATKVAPAVAGSMFSAEEPDTGGKKPQEYVRPYSFDYKPSAETDPEFKYRTGAPGESTAEQRYFTPEFKGLGVYKAGTEPGPSFYGKPTAEQLALYSKPKDSSTGLKAGGLAGLGRGGLRDGAFIVPADVVAHLGNGSNDAGQKILARGLGARPIKGKGDGMSDSIPTSIEGKQPARVADGEAYIPPEVVKKVGSKRLYAMMDKIRQARTGTKKQAPEVNPRQFMPA
jgi:hypothetical protein